MAKRITIVLDDEVHQKYRELCDRLKTSMQQELSEFIKNVLRKDGERLLAKPDNRDDN